VSTFNQRTLSTIVMYTCIYEVYSLIMCKYLNQFVVKLPHNLCHVLWNSTNQQQ